MKDVRKDKTAQKPSGPAGLTEFARELGRLVAREMVRRQQAAAAQNAEKGIAAD